MLSDLRPVQPASIASLQVHFASLHESLPQALPEDLLLSLSLCFRRLERTPSAEEASGYGASASAAIFAVSTLLLACADSTSQSRRLDISESALMKCLRIYQNALEREIVTRIVGLDAPDDVHRLKQALLAAARH